MSLNSSLSFLGASLVPAPHGSSGFMLVGSLSLIQAVLAVRILRAAGWVRLGFGWVPTPASVSVHGLAQAGLPACVVLLAV